MTKPNMTGWIDLSKNPPPTNEEAFVEVLFEDGKTDVGYVWFWRWGLVSKTYRIIGYRYADKRDFEEAAPAEDVVNNPKHYAKAIEPIDYIMKNELNFAEGSAIKYITRHRDKNGAEDIKKAIKFCEFILKYEYDEGVEKHQERILVSNA